MKYRIEKDSLGERELPLEAYYGIHTLRSKDAFQITKHGICRQMIKAFAIIKKSSALANSELQRMDKNKAEAICLSCDEILNGRLHGQFITDSLQGGGGVSMNLNASEVIANRANEMLKGEKGSYDIVDPINDLNMGQKMISTVMYAGKMSSIRLVKKLLTELKKLINAINEVAKRKEEVQTELMQMSKNIEKYYKNLDQTKDILLNVHPINDDFEDTNYNKKFVKYLCQFTTENFTLAKKSDSQSFGLDSYVILSSSLQAIIFSLSKSSNDIKCMCEKGLLTLPKVIDYSLNGEDVLELVKQVSYYTMGNDLTIIRAIEDGKMGGNQYQPIVYACLFESINLIRRTVRTVREELFEKVQ